MREEQQKPPEQPKAALRPGIKEAIEIFWKYIDNITPPIIPSDLWARHLVSTAVLLALGSLNDYRDKEEEKKEKKRKNLPICSVCDEPIKGKVYNQGDTYHYIPVHKKCRIVIKAGPDGGI